MKTACTAVLLAALALTSCSGGDPAPAGQPDTVDTTQAAPESTTPPAEPQTVEGARALAERQVLAFSGGDYAGTWDMWSAAGKAAITRDDYVRLNTDCPSAIEGLPISVVSARLENPNTAVVIIQALGVNASYNIVYEDGAWRWQPNPEGMAEFAKGVDVMIAEQRAEGECGD